MNERRGDARLSGSIVRQISTLVRPGQWVVLVDVSPSGALIAGRRPLRPGARVEIHFHGHGHRSAVWALVVRCAVAAMDADRVVYHAGLSFERREEWVREKQTHSGAAVPGVGSTSPSSSGEWLPAGGRALEVVDMEAVE